MDGEYNPQTELKPLVYEIRTVEDFMLVPAHRRALCLKEFDEYLDMLDSVKALNAMLGHDVVTVENSDTFHWIDDDKRQMTATFRDLSGDTIATTTIKMKG